jgi:hypothetical protein
VACAAASGCSTSGSGFGKPCIITSATNPNRTVWGALQHKLFETSRQKI